MKRLLTIAVVTIELALAGCWGGDDQATTSPPPSEPIETPTESAPAPGALPPEFVKCMADQGYDVESADDIHSAPQQVLQTCFGSLHGETP